MGTVTGCGAGLVAAGGLALLLTLAAPERPLRMLFVNDVGEAEFTRRDRNARSGGRVGAIATVCGSVLLIVGAGATSVILAAISAACVVGVCLWLYLAFATRQSYRMLVDSISSGLAAPAPKSAVRQSQGLYVGMGNGFEPGRGMADMPIDSPEAALAKATLRTSWRWALKHPLGARRDGM